VSFRRRPRIGYDRLVQPDFAERDFAALDSYQLLPRVLHEVVNVDASCTLLGQTLPGPIVPLVHGSLDDAASSAVSLVEAAMLAGDEPLTRVVALLKPEKMGELMPKVRRLSERGALALALDFTSLAETPPYGALEWRPRSREDLAELGAAASCPLWLYGVASPADAEVAMEAGLDAIVVHGGAGRHLGGPATIDLFPEIFDTVAGMLAVYAGGPVRSGIDVFKYLALGAEVVVAESDRSLASLRHELEYAMRLTGCATLAEIGYEAVFEPLFGEP
jgi:isopentenyl diphosphate isomerase/L-lactate dehydrogenase-like FMN-dependent dehydrogenase